MASTVKIPLSQKPNLQFSIKGQEESTQGYHNSSCYQAGRKVGGVTTLIPIQLRQQRLPDPEAICWHVASKEFVALIRTQHLTDKKAMQNLSLKLLLLTNSNMYHGWQPKITMKILKVPPTLGWYWAPEDQPGGKANQR